jgi:ferritin-like metal-binding protein YciE
MDEKSRDVLAKYLHDMYSLIGHGHQAIRRQREQLKDAGHPEAERAVAGWESKIDRHVAMLEDRLKGIGESVTSPLQDAAATVAGAAAGLYNAVRSEEASKSVRDDYTFFSHSAMSYFMLHTTAMSLGDQETARLAEQGYRDMAGFCMEIDRLMPGLVIHELEQDGHAARDVSADCARLVSEAWRPAGARSPV